MLDGHSERTRTDRHRPCDKGAVTGRDVPKRDNSTGFRCAMSGTDQPGQAADDGVLADAKPPCVALVPMVTPARWSQVSSSQRPLPNSTFVAHLIATAEHVPQTRSLRRATPADALTAYSANQHRLRGAGMRARQII